MPDSFRAALLCCLLLLFVLCSSGCAFTPPPTMEVVSVSWSEQTSEASSIEFDVVLRNRAAFRAADRDTVGTAETGGGGGVRLLEVHYTVELDGQVVYRGRSDARATLAAGTDRLMTLPAVVLRESFSGSGSAKSYRVIGHIRYLPDDRFSAILGDLGLSHRRSSFIEVGSLSASADAPGGPDS